MLGRRPLRLLGALQTTGGRLDAFGGSWFALSPTGDTVAPRSQGGAVTAAATNDSGWPRCAPARLKER